MQFGLSRIIEGRQICLPPIILYLCNKDGKYMTLNEAFSILIAKPFWYKDSGYSKQFAFRDKKNFHSGKLLPEERMRHYLKTAGWEQIQQEQWTDPKV